MKRLFVATVIMLGFNNMSFAQAQQPKTEAHVDVTRKQAEDETAKMEKALALTPDQVKPIMSINHRFALEEQSLNNQIKKGDKDPEKIRAIKDRKNMQYKSILTPEQFEKYQKMEEEKQKSTIKSKK